MLEADASPQTPIRAEKNARKKQFTTEVTGVTEDFTSARV